jgi:pyruvate-formate lyase-activating enzyme
MTTWTEFYNSIKDPAWPSCDQEDDFLTLPTTIQQECTEVFGYQIGSFRNKSKKSHRAFPIKTQTACQLKWNWSTVFLTTEETASCHRTNHHTFDTSLFDFHNTPEKINDRTQMLQGQWPKKGCDYCQNIERANGQSDRLTNLDFPGMHAPVELDQDLAATRVTPRILEIYFDNVCNLKCLYCGPYFSSLWDAENKKFGTFNQHGLTIPSDFKKSQHIESNKQKLFQWIRDHGHNLTVLNILGGEPLYQQELNQCIELFDQHPAPELKLQIFTNLFCKTDHLKHTVDRVRQLVDTNKIREFEITASLDCWGPQQEYVRFPLKLQHWEQNFNYLLEQDFINLIISSTVTPLTIKTLPDLLEKIQQWNKIRPVHHYQNSVNGPSHFMIDIFGNIFVKDFDRALELKPSTTPEQQHSKEYLRGIALQSASSTANPVEIKKLFALLNEMDRRRNTSWKLLFPWLVHEFDKLNLKV